MLILNFITSTPSNDIYINESITNPNFSPASNDINTNELIKDSNFSPVFTDQIVLNKENITNDQKINDFEKITNEQNYKFEENTKRRFAQVIFLQDLQY